MKRLILLLLLSVLLIGCKENNTVQKVGSGAPEFKFEGELFLMKPSQDTIATLQIEIADNDYETETGLMHRNEMKDSQGMLFVFQEERPHSFYMKNTLIPLDIVWIGSDKTIKSISKNAQPMNESSIFSEGPVQYVLEINAGLVEQWGLDIGDTVFWNKL